MKLYLAHNWAAREYLKKEILPVLICAGHSTTSTWITTEQDSTKQAFNAEQDLADVREADALVHFSEQFGSTPGRGKYVELGYAVGIRKPVYVVGVGDETIFYFLGDIGRLADIDALLSALSVSQPK